MILLNMFLFAASLPGSAALHTAPAQASQMLSAPAQVFVSSAQIDPNGPQWPLPPVMGPEDNGGGDGSDWPAPPPKK
jgi:hypothetical protein